MAVREERGRGPRLAGWLAGWMGEAEGEGRGKGVMFGGGQRCVYVCICV